MKRKAIAAIVGIGEVPTGKYPDRSALEALSSKMLSEPLHAKESNVLADGASAFVVTSAERAADVTDTPVYLLGASGRVTHYALSQEKDMAFFGYADAARDAFAMASAPRTSTSSAICATC